MYANRRRVQGNYSKSLLRRRGELVERSFAHCYDTGGMRRTHLRKQENILKRLLIHVGGFNLSLIFRKLLGAGTPRELNNRAVALFLLLLRLFNRLGSVLGRHGDFTDSSARISSRCARDVLTSLRLQRTGGVHVQ